MARETTRACANVPRYVGAPRSSVKTPCASELVSLYIAGEPNTKNARPAKMDIWTGGESMHVAHIFFAFDIENINVSRWYMADKDGGADMNSTPISKLPPPTMLGGGAAETAASSLPQGANYQDILKSVDLARNNFAASGPPRQQQQHFQPAPSSYDDENPELEAMMRMRARAAAAQGQAQAARGRNKAATVKNHHARDAPAQAASKFDFKFLRSGLIVAAIVFVVLLKIAPLVATKLPFSIDSVTGKFTTVGLLIVSFLAGGTFLFADEMLKRYAA